MDAETRRWMEEQGYQVFDHAADAVGLTGPGERELLDLRIRLAISIRKMRESKRLSQKELAKRMKTTQPRVARIETGSGGVSIDQMICAYVAAGGKIEFVPSPAPDEQASAAKKVKPTGGAKGVKQLKIGKVKGEKAVGNRVKIALG